MKTKNQELLEKLNKAFANNDTEFVIGLVTENIKWTAVGDFTVEGKQAFSEKLNEMTSGDPYKLDIDKVITHGKEAAVNGLMTSKTGKRYAFCDVYTFNGFKNPKISEMTSYVVQVKH